MGIITATFGGIIRDVLGGEVPLILRKEIYVTAALLGAATFIAALGIGLPRSLAGSGIFACFALRALALGTAGRCRHTGRARARDVENDGTP